jgi:hypothetical protein
MLFFEIELKHKQHHTGDVMANLDWIEILRTLVKRTSGCVCEDISRDTNRWTVNEGERSNLNVGSPIPHK